MQNYLGSVALMAMTDTKNGSNFQHSPFSTLGILRALSLRFFFVVLVPVISIPAHIK